MHWEGVVFVTLWCWVTCTSWLKFWVRHVIHVHVRLSLSSPLALSTSICPSPSSSTSPFSCTSSSTLSSTTWSPCKTCAPPRTRRVTTPTTPTPPSHLKTGRSESNLRLCGNFWNISSNISSLMEMTKVQLSSQRSTHAHKSSAPRIEETVLENLCSNLPSGSRQFFLHLLHLTCVYLVFLVKCCNGSSLTPARPRCDGRPFASPLFRRLAGRGALFRFPVSMGFFTFSLWLAEYSCMTQHLAIGKILDVNVGADAVHCLAALWLQRSQSILVQDIQSAKDIDLTCFKTLPIKATTCLQGPMAQGRLMIGNTRRRLWYFLKLPRWTCSEFRLITVPMWIVPHWWYNLDQESLGRVQHRYQPITDPSENTAKQVPWMSGLCGSIQGWW